MIHHKLSKSTNLTNCDIIAFDLYLTQKMSGSHGFQLNLNTSGEDGYNKLIALDNKDVGWLHFEFKKSDFTKAVDTADWSDINRLRLTWFNYNGSTASADFYIDNLRAYKQAAPQPDPKPEPQPDPDVEKVIEAIDKLPPPGEVEHEHREQIHAVRDQFEKLNETQRPGVTNSQKLTEVLNAYEALPPQVTVLYGDIDLNGTVAAADALLALQHVVGKTSLEGDAFTAGDVDGNTFVNAADALLILQRVVNKIEQFPIEG